MIWVDPAFVARLGGRQLDMSSVFAIQGEVYRAPPGAQRKTLRFERGGAAYFLKLHWGVGWREIIKNWVLLKPPVLGARNEWRAIRGLQRIGVDTMTLAAFGESGWNPARRRSFVITEELSGCISLEDLSADWLQQPPRPAVKWALIRRVAEISARLHAAGLNHCDLYICHFLLQQPWSDPAIPPRLYLIDLHRVQQRRSVPRRWLIKDLAALYFSVLDRGLSRRDLLRFVRDYTGLGLRAALARPDLPWQQIVRRATDLARRRPVASGSGLR